MRNPRFGPVLLFCAALYACGGGGGGTTDPPDDDVGVDASDVDTSVDPDADTGEDPDADTGEDPDADTGEDPDADTGDDPDADTGEPDTDVGPATPQRNSIAVTGGGNLVQNDNYTLTIFVGGPSPMSTAPAELQAGPGAVHYANQP